MTLHTVQRISIEEYAQVLIELEYYIRLCSVKLKGKVAMAVGGGGRGRGRGRGAA
jgi:hypothetical protein